MSTEGNYLWKITKLDRSIAYWDDNKNRFIITYFMIIIDTNLTRTTRWWGG